MMQLTCEKVGDVAVILLPMEELDASNAGDFKGCIAPFFETHPILVLNLSKLRFVDSSGLGALLACLRMASAKGSSLRLCEMSTQVRSLFEAVRMNRIFDIYNSQIDAISA